MEKTNEIPKILKWVTISIFIIGVLAIISTFLHTEDKFISFLKTLIIIAIIIGVGILFLFAKNESIEYRHGVEYKTVTNPGSSGIVIIAGIAMIILAIVIFFSQLLAIFNIDSLSLILLTKDLLNDKVTLIIVTVIVYIIWFISIMKEEYEKHEYDGIIGKVLYVVIGPIIGAAIVTAFVMLVIVAFMFILWTFISGYFGLDRI